jgi:pSer/pThr/pTyr-binding forkhead associated (FHA) protein
MAYLVVSRNGEELCRKELEDAVTIGRQASCDLWLPDPRVSREHCRIEPAGRKWVIRDLGSRNGTHVGGNRVDMAELVDGQNIVVGDVTITFHAVGFVDRRPTAPPRVDPDMSALTQWSLVDCDECGKALPRPVVHPPDQTTPTSGSIPQAREVLIQVGKRPASPRVAPMARRRPARPQPSVPAMIEPEQNRPPIASMLDGSGVRDVASRRNDGLRLGDIWGAGQCPSNH